MTIARMAAGGRFRPEALFRPGSVAVLTAGSPLGGQVMRNLLRGGYGGAVLPVQADALSIGGVLAYPTIAALPVTPDLAMICDDAAATEESFTALAARGTYAAVMTALSARPRGWMRGIAERTGVRSFGPGSFGVAVPSIGLDATLGHLPARSGRVALVSQSASLCRVVLDWATPNGVGFSHIVGVGANDDLGFELVLDWLSRDPGTGAILLDLRRLQSPRMFLSAARAAARLRPVVAIRPGGRIGDPAGMADATLAAALNRVGVLPVESLEDLLAAAETLTRAKPAAGEALAIVTNALGPARLAADAAVRDGLGLLRHGDAELVPAADLASAALAASQEAGAGGVLVLHAPEGEGDLAAADAIGKAAAESKRPVIVCAMGEHTGEPCRRALAAYGVPAFAEPATAVRAFLHLVQDRRNRAAAREMPASAVLSVKPDRDAVRTVVSRGDTTLSHGPAGTVLTAYGLTGAMPAQAGGLRVETDVDPVFGPRIAIAPYFARAGADVVVDLPPLNLALASAMVARSAVARASGPQGMAILADRLVRVSALLVDVREIAALSFDPFAPDEAAITLCPPGGSWPALALPPYPSDLIASVVLGGETLTIRPIRPEDADAQAAFFAHLTPEDVRFRFFAALRRLPAEELVRMTQIDYDREMAFVAVRPATGETLGVARLVCETLSREAEFAVVVRPDAKGRGLASHLMRQIIAWGRTRGMMAVVGQVLSDNRAMLAFIRRLGFTVHSLPDDPQVMEARLAL